MLYSIKNLEKTRPGDRSYKLLLQDIRISQGTRLAITGPSGCGKSTTLDILGLSLQPDHAEEFDFAPPGQNGIAIMQLWRQHRKDQLTGLRLSHMGYVLQSGELLPFLTCGENMIFTARLSGIAYDEACATARMLAERLDINHLWNAMPQTLSVGERQRAAIVRALASKPQVILADEPTAALDPIHADDVMTVFLHALEEFGSALILATHNAEWAKKGNLQEACFHIEKNDNQATAILNFNPGADA